MLSRAADSIYWMSRYVERAESTASLVDVHLRLVLDLPPGMSEDWAPVLCATGDEASYRARFGEATRATVVAYLAFDAENPSSMLSCLRSARENARSVREHLSPDMWEQLNRSYLMVRSASASALDATHELFADLRMSSLLFAGVMDATMLHGEGWHFGRLGRFFERADQTSRLLELLHPGSMASPDATGTAEDARWAVVLKAAGAFETYRRRHGTIAASRIADFLILDRELPHSIHHALIEAEASLGALSRSPQRSFPSAAVRRLGRLRSELEYAVMDEILADGLEAFLRGLRLRLGQVDAAIFETFFALPPIAEARSTRSV